MRRLLRRCPGPVSRRSFLEVGGIGLGSLGLADFLRARAAAGPLASDRADTSVILVWLPGGPPHMETYDMKPDAPVEYRGELRPIRTNIPGIEVCELLPMHARIADRFTLIRSIGHEFSDHGGGSKRFMTGRIPRTPVGFVNDAPAAPAIVAKMREHVRRGVPNYVSFSDPRRDTPDTFAFGAAYLGPAFTPFSVAGDPSEKNFEVRNLSLSTEMENRLTDRIGLLRGMDRLRREIDRSGAIEAMDKYSVQAVEMLTNPAARNAFDLSQESLKVRERYGNHAWGQRSLIARRLVEAGSSFVTVVMENPMPQGVNPPPGVMTHGDAHAVNGHIFVDARYRFPIFDRAVSALIEDVYDRGLDEKVMVVVAGEFGRHPLLEHAVGIDTGAVQPGRGHWPSVQSVLVAGAGMRTGQVVGSSTAKGEVPRDRPLTPNDLWATVYRHLGIDYSTSFLDHSGRPMPILATGEPIYELL